MIEWLWPWAFAAAPAPLLVRLLMRPSERTESALTVPDLLAYTSAEVSHSNDWQRQLIKLGLIWLTWLFLVAASARPQWTGDPVTLPTSGRDLMLAVDISGSMATQDMQVSNEFLDRLTVVKAVVGQFAQARLGDRVGLILFGTNAYLQAPLTFDLKSVNRLLVEAPVGIAGGKTAIGDAIGLAVKRLRQRAHDEKVLILLTDGANNVGEVEPAKAAELAARDGITIYTVGVGADEMRLPSVFRALGNRVTNPSADLDEATLRNIAQVTGGKYFRARDPRALVEIYAEIDELEPVAQEAETYRPIQALYYWPMTISLACLILLLIADIAGRQPRRGN